MNMIKEKDPEKRQALIKSFKDVWAPRRLAAINMSQNSDAGEFEALKRLKPDGSTNIAASFDNMMDDGLFGLENPLISKEDLENESYFPNPRTRKTIRKRHPQFFGDMSESIDEDSTTWYEELELHVNSQLVL
jgi:hypothetical protein